MFRNLFQGVLLACLCGAASFAADAAAPAAKPAELTPRQIYEKDGPAVVLIMAQDADGKGELGTGSIIDSAGHVLTNAHVVLNSAHEPFPSVHVYFKPAKLTGDTKQDLRSPHTAKVLRFNAALDLALLELEEQVDAPAVIAIGDAEAVQSGDAVVAIGHPEQGGLWTLTTGVVSTVVADLGGVPGKNAFQTDASINRGNSGGPLIDRGGNLIGVNTSMARKASDGLTITSVNFSLQSGVVKKWLANSVASAATAAAQPASAAPVAQDVAPAAPAVEPAPAPNPAPPAPTAAAPSKPRILTPVKPYAIDQLMKDMAEMDDMGKEMHDEIQRRAGGSSELTPE